MHDTVKSESKSPDNATARCGASAILGRSVNLHCHPALSSRRANGPVGITFCCVACQSGLPTPSSTESHMPRRSKWLITSVSLTLAACTDPAALSPVAPSAIRLPTAAPIAGRYLVAFDGAPAIASDVLGASGGRVVDSIPSMGVLVVDGVTNPDAFLAAHPRYVESGFDATISPIASDMPVPDIFAESVPGQENTPWYQSGVMWDMKDMHASAGWSLTNGGQGINACIVDTGIDANHQEISGRVTLRKNFVTSPAAEAVATLIYDPNGHGTHVSGTVAAGGVVTTGVAPRANLMGARVLNTAGSGTESAIINGINWCVANGAHVINMSLGGIRYTGSAQYNNSLITYGAAIKAATDAGVVVVTAAGNDNLQLPNPALITVPAQVPGTIVVGATGPLTRSSAPLPPTWDPFDPNQVWRSPDNRAYYSNFGSAVHVFAPGGRGNVPLSEVYRFVDRVAQGGPNDQIWSLCSGNTAQLGAVNAGGAPSGSASCSGQTNRYIQYAGTSMATPHVVGMAVVLYEALGGVRNAANRARVESCIENTADPIGPSSIYGPHGRVNVEKALAALDAGTC